MKKIIIIGIAYWTIISTLMIFNEIRKMDKKDRKKAIIIKEIIIPVIKCIIIVVFACSGYVVLDSYLKNF